MEIYEKKIKEIQTLTEHTLRSLIVLCEENGFLTEAGFIVVVQFLKSIIGTTANILEIQKPGTACHVYAEIEKDARAGGINSIDSFSSEFAKKIEMDQTDFEKSMNDLGRLLSITLFKGLLELPESMQTREAMLRPIEALLTNVLHQKFEDPHYVLEQLTSHVHGSLMEVQKRFVQ